MAITRTRLAWAAVAVLALAAFIGSVVYYKYLNRHPGDTYQIGAIYDLTGSLNYQGQSSLQGAQLAVDEINRSGGIGGKDIELRLEDGKTDPGATRLAFLKLLGDKVPIVIGFNSSGGAMKTAPEAEKAKVVLFSSGAATPKLTAAGNFVFRNRLSGGIEASEMARVAYEVLGYRRGSILAEHNDYGQSYADAFAQAFQKRGGAIIRRESFMSDSDDFKSQLTAVAQDSPEFIYLAAYAPSAGAVLRQAKDRGLETHWLAANAVEGPMLFKLAQGGAEGLLLSVAQYRAEDPASRAFATAYHSRYGRMPDMFAAHAYDSVRIVAKLIEERGYSAEDIRAGLVELRDYPGVSGVTNFDQYGDVAKPVAFKVAHADAFTEVDPKKLARTSR